MARPDPVDFAERERFIVSCYRSGKPSDTRRMALYDMAFVLASIVCIVLFLVQGEMGYALAGYAVVVGRLLYLTIEGARWIRDFQSIFAKYDAKLRELTSESFIQKPTDQAPSKP